MADKKPTIEEALATGITDTKSDWWKSLLAKALEEKLEEEEYLKGLADKLSVSKKKNYTIARSIVMDVHLRLESMMNSCINVCCVVGAGKYDLQYKMDKVNDAVSDIDFMKKIKIIESLSIVKPSSIATLIKMNNLRRAFAHGYQTEHKDYNYYGDSIFEKKTIEKLRVDYREILDEILKGKIFGEKKD